MSDIRQARIAILGTDGFEQSELDVPRERLKKVGAQVDVISLKQGEIRGWKKTDWGDPVPVDRALSDARPADYDCLVLPGGQINPDVLQTKEEAVAFVRSFCENGKLVAAICHAPWLLIEADAVRDRNATSYHSISTDMKNAGAKWRDEEVVTDGNVITSRSPDDLDAFCKAIERGLSGEAAPARAAHG